MSTLAIDAEPPSTLTRWLHRLRHWSDASGWNRFYAVYGPIIARFAHRYGLSPHECQDVVQETMLRVATNIAKFDPSKGPSKGWLFQCVRWKILDVIRGRPKNTCHLVAGEVPAGTQIDEGSWEPGVSVFQQIWDHEWADHRQQEALEAVRRKVSGLHYQIFHLYVVEEVPASKVAATLGVTVAQVYLVGCRLRRLFKKALAAQGEPQPANGETI